MAGASTAEQNLFRAPRTTFSQTLGTRIQHQRACSDGPFQVALVATESPASLKTKHSFDSPYALILARKRRKAWPRERCRRPLPIASAVQLLYQGVPGGVGL